MAVVQNPWKAYVNDSFSVDANDSGTKSMG
jgi:hypothetical protein